MTKLLGLLFLVFISCRNDSRTELSNNSYREKLDSKTLLISSNVLNENQQSRDTTYDFLNKDGLEFWAGSIQGASKKDLFILGEYYDEEISYDLVFASKKYESNPQYLLKLFKESNNDYFQNFNCYSFLVLKKEADNPQTEFDKFSYNFPFEVVAFVLMNEGYWKKVASEEVGSVKDLGIFKYEVVNSK